VEFSLYAAAKLPRHLVDGVRRRDEDAREADENVVSGGRTRDAASRCSHNEYRSSLKRTVKFTTFLRPVRRLHANSLIASSSSLSLSLSLSNLPFWRTFCLFCSLLKHHPIAVPIYLFYSAHYSLLYRSVI